MEQWWHSEFQMGFCFVLLLLLWVATVKYFKGMVSVSMSPTDPVAAWAIRPWKQLHAWARFYISGIPDILVRKFRSRLFVIKTGSFYSHNVDLQLWKKKGNGRKKIIRGRSIGSWFRLFSAGLFHRGYETRSCISLTIQCLDRRWERKRAACLLGELARV